ncbi:MAG: twin-arginine translocase TatA/TatE family subunit [Prevotella sp.]
MNQLLFIGTTELMLIAGIALLLFGGKKLPEMMRGLGQGVSEFKKGTRDVVEPINEVKNIVEETEDNSLDNLKSPISDASEQK